MIRQQIRKVFRAFGFDLKRLTPDHNPSVQLVSGLNLVSADVVFDVGANVGQFAQNIRKAGFTGTIVSFEPQSKAHDALTNAAQADPSWHVHPRTAIGDEEGEIEINISANSVSSSALPMLSTHAAAEISSTYIGAENAPVTRLDAVASQYLTDNAKPFIKIDTQGFEGKVLDGAEEALSQAVGVLLELSLVPYTKASRCGMKWSIDWKRWAFPCGLFKKDSTIPERDRLCRWMGYFCVFSRAVRRTPFFGHMVPEIPLAVLFLTSSP